MSMARKRTLNLLIGYTFIHLWLYRPLLGPDRFFSFVILYTVSRTPLTGDQRAARPLPTHRTAQTLKKKRTQTSTRRVGFEPTTAVFEREKTVHALGSAATVTSLIRYTLPQNEKRNLRPIILLNILLYNR
jgi:hypothetical protein